MATTRWWWQEKKKKEGEQKMEHGVPPMSFGPCTWHLFFMISRYLDEEGNVYKKEDQRRIIQLLPLLLPCRECRVSATHFVHEGNTFIELQNLEHSNSITEYMFGLKLQVNKKLMCQQMKKLNIITSSSPSLEEIINERKSFLRHWNDENKNQTWLNWKKVVMQSSSYDLCSFDGLQQWCHCLWYMTRNERTKKRSLQFFKMFAMYIMSSSSPNILNDVDVYKLNNHSSVGSLMLTFMDHIERMDRRCILDDGTMDDDEDLLFRQHMMYLEKKWKSTTKTTKIVLLLPPCNDSDEEDEKYWNKLLLDLYVIQKDKEDKR
jgi:hypothetical protein